VTGYCPYGLTTRQYVAFKFIDSYIREHGSSPSTYEIARGMGNRSRCYVPDILRRLAERGVVTYAPGMARSVRIVAGAVTVNLPPELDAAVRRLADEAAVTPEAIVVEIVRDRMKGISVRSDFVSVKHSPVLSSAAEGMPA